MSDPAHGNVDDRGVEKIIEDAEGGDDGVEGGLTGAIVPVHLIGDYGYVGNLPLLGVGHKFGERDFRVFPRACAALDDMPEDNETGGDQHPEDYCFHR